MKYNGFETNDKAGMFPHRHSEQGLSLPETMVTKEEALSKLNKIKINLYAIENGNGVNLSDDERIEIMQGFAREIISDTETLEKFIEQQ